MPKGLPAFNCRKSRYGSVNAASMIRKSMPSGSIRRDMLNQKAQSQAKSSIRLIEHAASKPVASTMPTPSALDFSVVCISETSGDSTDRVSGFISPAPEAGFTNRLRLGRGGKPEFWGRRQPFGEMVPVERIELPTFGLQNRCSTAELNRRRADS
jgi:hypothetical protein